MPPAGARTTMGHMGCGYALWFVLRSIFAVQDIQRDGFGKALDGTKVTLDPLVCAS